MPDGASVCRLKCLLKHTLCVGIDELPYARNIIFAGEQTSCGPMSNLDRRGRKIVTYSPGKPRAESLPVDMELQ